MRTFNVLLDDTLIDTVCFVGEEYNEATVKAFLCEVERMNRDIVVKQIKEVVE